MKKDQRIEFVKLLFPFLATLTAIIVLVFAIIIPKSKDLHFSRQKEFIEQYTDMAVAILKDHQDMVEKAIFTVEEAKALAIAHIRDLRYGSDEKNYFWIIDTQPVVIMHPYRSDLEGSNVAEHQDTKGTYLFKEMVELVEEKGVGYVLYYWQFKDQPEIVAEKLSYIKLFEPWGWIIGTGLYLEETYEQISSVISSITIISGIVISIVLGLSVYILRQGFFIARTKHELIDKLFESENKYKFLVEFLNEGIVVIDSDGSISYVNDKLCNMLGYTREEMLGVDMYRFFDSENCTVLKAQIEARKMGADQPYELSWKTKQGNNLATIVSPKPIRGRDGDFRGSFSVVTDITRQKATELELQSAINQKNSLLREVHHRVKNNLQLISSLLNLQKGKFDDPPILEALTDSQLRVQTMANVHELLYQGENFDRIDMKSFIEQISSNLKSTYLSDASLVTISTSSDTVHLQVEQAIPCGLILNELLSNALKYAFPDLSGENPQKDCTVTIEMKREDRSIVLRIADNGIGLPEGASFESEVTLGLKLVSLLSEQLEGSVSVDGSGSAGSTGAVITIAFPYNVQ